MLFVFTCVLFLSVGADELLQTHALFRHGDRSPIECYPTDPNLSYWEKQPWGSLTTIGMTETFNQGLKLKQRYTDEMKFTSADYREEEIFVVSSTEPRCLQSASSYVAGFYSASKGTYPNISGWPSGWSPVPIHTVESPNDKTLEVGSDCKRYISLVTARLDNKDYKEWEVSNLPMHLELSRGSGYAVTDVEDNGLTFDCIRIERDYRGLPQPDWVTDKLYNHLYNSSWRSLNYMDGLADFGLEDDVELLRVLGGPLLTEITAKMNVTTHTGNGTKMFLYSAHDITVDALARVLGCKLSVIGIPEPDYAASLILELWKAPGYYYVKMLYSSNASSPFIDVTSLISGCGGQQNCPFTMFYNRNRPFYVKNINELCDQIPN